MRNQGTWGNQNQPANNGQQGNWGQPQQQSAPATTQGNKRAPRQQQAQNAQSQPQHEFRGLDRGFARGSMICNLADDPTNYEVRQVGDNYCVTVPVVVGSGDAEKKPSVFLLTFWNGLGQALCQYKRKGHGLHVEFEMNSRQDGQGKWHQNINVTSVQYLN